MKQFWFWLGALAWMLCGATPATAQESGAVGLTMGYPSSVGVMWHVAERLALRPDIAFATSASDNTPNSQGTSPIRSSSSSSTTIGAGISGLFYWGKWDALRTYVAPRFAYTRRRGSSELSTESITLSPSGFVSRVTQTTTTSTTTTKSAMGLFGATYSLHKRFSVFGEVGLGYDHSTNRSTTTPELPNVIGIVATIPSTHGWSTRTGAGVILYF